MMDYRIRTKHREPPLWLYVEPLPQVMEHTYHCSLIPHVRGATSFAEKPGDAFLARMEQRWGIALEAIDLTSDT